MVAKVNPRESISKALNYNEAKVRAGTAELLLAAGFGCDIGRLTFSEKVERFQLLNQRNEGIKKNTLHIFLSFPREEVLPADTMRQIAVDYMRLLGFGDQPYIVYEHKDTGNPHMHIVTNTVRENGDPIPLHNIGLKRSTPAREELERKYGLIVAKGRNTRNTNLDEPPSLSSKVQEVTGSYKYSSLDELNMILAQSGMTAWRGAPGSAQYTNRGLIYSHIDDAGYRTGAPVKSSDLSTRPTLDWLEKRFVINRVRKLAALPHVADRVTAAFKGNPDPAAIARRLDQRKIGFFLQRDKAGQPASLYFIDHYKQAVFTAEELGLSSADLVSRLALFQHQSTQTPLPRAKVQKTQKSSLDRSSSRGPHQPSLGIQTARILFSNETGAPGPAGDEPPKKKKRKRRPY